MRYTTRQFLLFITCLGAWFGCLARGHYLFGTYGVVTFGLLFGIALFLIFRLLIRWQTTSLMERTMFTVAIVASLSAGFFLSNVAYGYGFHISREKMREASRLQAELLGERRFDSVLVSYEDPPNLKGEWLWVRERFGRNKI